MSGSFSIPKLAIEILLNSKASALVIVTYLVIAKHTDAKGRLSSCGLKAIKKYTGANDSLAKTAVEKLLQINLDNEFLILSPTDWEEYSNEMLPVAKFELAKTRFVVNDFFLGSDEKVWFSNNLVEGFGKFSIPLKRLRVCGDFATRLLLLCYTEHNLQSYGGVDPKLLRHYYLMKKMNKLNDYQLWHGSSDGRFCSIDWIRSVAHVDYNLANLKQKAEIMTQFFKALDDLDNAGFIYQVVTVFDRPIENQEAQVIYELDTKSKHGYKPEGERGLSGEVAKISNLCGFPVTDSSGRFYGKYAAILPYGEPFIYGVYRLRFRVSNNKNYGVTEAWTRIYTGQKDAFEWLTDIYNKLQNSNLS